MKMHSSIWSILISFLFLDVNPMLADATSTEAYLKLTEEMRNIVDRNQKNFDSVRCIHGKIKIIRTASFYNDKGSRITEHIEENWYDGSHSRMDILESKFNGKETDPLLFKDESTGGEISIEPLSIGHTEIRSIESQMTYSPRRDMVFISPPLKNDKRPLNANNLMHYQTIGGRTIKELALHCAENDFYITVKSETADGEDCLLLECYFDKYEITRKIWIVPSKGYCIKKMELVQKGIVRDEYTTTLKEYLPGIWWFDSVKAKTLGGPEGFNPDETLEISVKSLTLNEPIDPKTFTLAGTNIPPGTRVKDEISNINYVYGTGYELAQEDVDLALEALKDSHSRPGREIEDSPDKPSQELHSDSNTSSPRMEKDNPNGLNSATSAGSENTNGRFLTILFLGSGIALAAIALFVIKSIRG